jgi:two-component system cell cycle sensor histidine kinase/response regulator CckA
MPSLLGLQLQTILDSVGVALAVVDNQGRFVFWNQAALDMLGEHGDLSGVSLQEWRRSYKFQDSEGRDIPAEEAPILRALKGEQVEPQDIRITLPDGRHKWFHGASHPFSVLGLAGVFVVITDETKEVELRRNAEQFHRIEAIGVLAGKLAHDLNNMLSVVSENLALALSDPGVPDCTRTRLQQMVLALQKGAALSRRLLQCSRAQKLQTQLVRINEVVDTALDLARPLLGSGIHLQTELRSGLPNVEADPSEIEQVIINLIMNARDAMPQGGELIIRTDVADGDAIPSDKGERARQYVLITVADTGTGIPEDLQTRVFDPFFTTKPGKGAGLGLSSAYGIVRQHKGLITVQSAPGAGTKFNIYLPVMAAR